MSDCRMDLMWKLKFLAMSTFVAMAVFGHGHMDHGAVNLAGVSGYHTAFYDHVSASAVYINSEIAKGVLR
jgi:hypothetical protein